MVKKIQDLTSLGNLATGDKLVGERTAGQTRLMVFNDITGTANRITVSSYAVDIASTYVGQATITVLGTVATGTWQGTIVGMSYGGTGASLTASNGGIVYSTASAMAVLSGTATANKMLLSGSTAAPTWSTSTIPTSAGATANKVLLSDGTNYVLSTPTFPNASATSGKIIVSDGTNWISSTPTYPNASATALKWLRSDGTNWIASTSTLPDSYSQGDILYASASNVLSTLAKNTSATRYLSNTGTTNNPAWAQIALTTGVSGVLPVANGGTNASTASITSFNNITGYTAAGATGTTSTNLVFSTSPTLVTPTLGVATATSLAFSPTTGGIVGTTAADSASAGRVGEVLTSTVTAQAITSNTFTNVTSISLTAGDWDVYGNVFTNPAGTTTQAQVACGLNTTSATLPAQYSTVSAYAAGISGGINAPFARINVSSTTTVYLVGIVVYAVSTLTISGTITARRVR